MIYNKEFLIKYCEENDIDNYSDYIEKMITEKLKNNNE